MENKTNIHAENGKQELLITRNFDLPLDLLFQAHSDPNIVAQWMGTQVLKFESETHGEYRFETTNPQGKVVFRARGVFHDFIPNQRITRTFEMEGAQFDPQLEFFTFEKLTDRTSRLSMHIIFRSLEMRERLLQMPFASGLNWAHDRLQQIAANLNSN